MTGKNVKFQNVEYEGLKCNVTVELNLEDSSEGECFTASAYLKHGREYLFGGQCLDELLNETSLKDNKKFIEIHDLWKKYHLNDLHAGTVEQENKLAESEWGGVNANYYEEQCEYLKKFNLYEVPLPNGSMYKFGTQWLFWAIPEEDLERIRKLLD